MVVKRTCSFCAGEIEPGTGSMFVKRDGTVYHFCTSSCRKQQLHLGRVGHRLKWTRAHAIRKAAEQAGPRSSEAAPPAPAARPTEPKESPPAAPSPTPAAKEPEAKASEAAKPKKKGKSAKPSSSAASSST
jgi:large subunit ribosomal protein L24e